MKLCNRWFVFISFTSLVLWNAAQAETKASSPTSVVARVNGTDITREQLDVAIQETTDLVARQGQSIPAERQATLESDTLQQLIAQQLILEKAKTAHVTNLEDTVQERVQEIRQQFPDPKQFSEWLTSNKLTKKKLNEKLAEGIRVETYIDQEVRSKIKISPDEVKTFYDGHPQFFSQPEKVRASHILVTLSATADDAEKTKKKSMLETARKRIVGGGDFAKVAAEVSEDPRTKSQGGDLGYFGHGEMPHPLEEAAFAMKSNEVSQVVTSELGYHILKQTDLRPKSVRPLEEVKGNIEKFLVQQKTRDNLLTYVETLKKEAKIELLTK